MDGHGTSRSHAVRHEATRPRRRLRPGRSVEALEPRQLLAQVFTVDSTADTTTAGTLRWAIGQVNLDTTDTAASPDRIEFALPTSDPGYNASTGVWRIAPAAGLPMVTRPVVIDGYTQAGASPNTATTTDNAVLKIEVIPSVFVYADGLVISGGSSTVEGLAIGGFIGTAVQLTGVGGDVVAGNFLGVDASGTSAAGGSQSVGILTSHNTIGGTTLASRNLAASGQYYDIAVARPASYNLIAGNFVGLDATGRKSLDGENLAGIELNGGTGNTVGGTTVAARNVVAGQGGVAIWDEFYGAGGNLIEGNYVGTDSTGTVPIYNPVYKANGIEVDAAGDTIGGAAAGAGNLASGNLGVGISVGGRSNLVLGNRVGLDSTGMKALGNGKAGIELVGPNNTVGGAAAGTGNIISGNGIGIIISNGSGAAILGNWIGTDPAGATGLGNTSDGIQVSASLPGDLIGGTAPGAGNTIAYNGGAGVDILPGPNTPPASGDAILSNSIHDNAKLGIDLGSDGVTPNTPGGPHAGPNHLQNYPVLLAAESSGGSTTIVGTLNSTPNATFTVQVFANPMPDSSGYGQGQTYLGQLTNVKTDASGNARFGIVVPSNVAGQYLSATATDAGGDTSEFSQDLREGLTPIADVAVSIAGQTATTTLGGAVSFTYRVTNLGPSTATNVTAVDTLPTNLAGLTVSASDGTSSIVNGVFTDVVPSLPSGGSFTVVVSGTAAAVGAVVNSLVASASQLDPDPSNNTASVAIPVTPLPTTTTLVVSPNPAKLGQAVTFTATVTSSLVGAPPGGAVTFLVDGRAFAAVPLVASAGTTSTAASYTTSALPAGAHTVVASFVDGGVFAPSASAAAVETVVAPPADVAVSVVGSTASATLGGPVTIYFRVANYGPGTATNVVVSDVLPTTLAGATIAASLGTSSIVNGVFTDVVPSLPPGGSFLVALAGTAAAAGRIDNTLAAVASQADPYAPNNAATASVPVARQATTTTLTTSAPPLFAGQSVTLTATVAPKTSTGVPTGTVTFYVDGRPTTPQALAASSTGAIAATFTSSAYSAGSHTIVAIYNGDQTFSPSSSLPSATLTINPATAAPLPPQGPPPSAVQVLRYGYHAAPTALVIEFNEPVDPLFAGNPANFAILGPRNVPIPIVSAMPLPGGMAVVLQPASRLSARGYYTLTIAGGLRSFTGVAARSGQALLVSPGDLVPNQPHPAGPVARGRFARRR